MKAFVSILIFVVVVIVFGLIYIYSGSYDISVENRDKGLTRWVFETTMENSVEHNAKDIEIPNLEDTAMVKEGFSLFNRSCGCHGNPEREASKSFNPMPPNFANSEMEWKPNEIFWIVKNGIKMTAMPTYADRLDDDKIWNIVAFLQKLPGMTKEEYHEMNMKYGEKNGHR